MADIPRPPVGSITPSTPFDVRDAILYGPRSCIVDLTKRCQERAGCGGCAIYQAYSEKHSGTRKSSEPYTD